MTDEEFRALVAAGPAVVMVEKGHMIGLLNERDRLAADVERLRKVLESIAANTCCERCQEAALVARAALTPPETAPCV